MSSFSVGGMRPFGVLAMEMITMGAPMVQGMVDGDWRRSNDRSPRPKDEVLRMWDEATKDIDRLWPKIAPEKFSDTLTAFGEYPGVGHDLVLYVIDNEIHHRGQGYVYLRALGIEPPAFFDRS